MQSHRGVATLRSAQPSSPARSAVSHARKDVRPGPGSPNASGCRHVVRDPARETVVVDLAGSHPENHRRGRFGRHVEINPIETEKDDDGGECGPLIAVDKGM